MNSKLKELTDKLEAVRAEFRASGKDAVHAALQDVLNKYPKLESFSWRQYTPYFNDGDTCEFGVHAIREFAFDGKTYGDYGDNSTKNYNYDTRSYETLPGCEEALACERELCQLSRQLQKAEEVLQVVFGDHVEVTVTRDGISTDGVDHD